MRNVIRYRSYRSNESTASSPCVWAIQLTCPLAEQAANHVGSVLVFDAIVSISVKEVAAELLLALSLVINLFDSNFP